MMIFDLDGTLADCSHRRHFVTPDKAGLMKSLDLNTGKSNLGFFLPNGEFEEWKPDWKAFYEACDLDKPIQPVLDTFIHLTQGEPFNHDVQIWSGRCESVREKTLNWLVNLTGYCEDKLYWDRRLKMRPFGDYTSNEQLKERWLDEYLSSMWPPLTSDFTEGETIYRKDPIEFVFDSCPKAINMWRRRGIFVFNCSQSGEEF